MITHILEIKLGVIDCDIDKYINSIRIIEVDDGTRTTL